ncbi:phage tail protein I [Caulobacter sp. RL271]|uniref:Phage tail protein I n=1 Tax=Caulobacter segnis TaxID=88688 RepID=A0ABY4ZZ20_9CAUL|nr:phage tail protein I [Caulobacter segnis]USQ97242.1 phage tail protein I [Caulobacter segnis]
MTFSGSDALPDNSTGLERSWADMEWARLAGLDPAIVRTLVDPATCPLELLPWLAWSMSVDTWDPSWSEATKRAVIAAAPATHRAKGTVRAVRLALQALGIDFDLDEWWQMAPEGRRGTFRVTAWADGSPLIDLPLIVALRQAIRGAKPKSRVGDLRLGLREIGTVHVGGAGQSVITSLFVVDSGI